LAYENDDFEKDDMVNVDVSGNRQQKATSKMD